MSIAFPKLGTQNGKLSWDEVGPLMASYLGELDIDAIDGLAKTSLKKIKDYMNSLRYPVIELPGITNGEKLARRKGAYKTSSPQQKRKCPSRKDDAAVPLFPSQQQDSVLI